MDTFVRFIKLLTALGLLALAAAIVFFASEIRQFRQQLPALLEQIDDTAQRVSPIINEVAELKQFVPQIIEQSKGYQQLIPEVLARVDMINQQVPIIINEVSTVTQSIEPILKQSDEWRAELPALLKLVDETNQTVRSTNKTIAGTNQQIANALPQIPLILAESEALRIEVPEIIAKAEALVGQAEQVGKDASKGMLTGFVGGILHSPFELIGKIGKDTTEILRLKDANSVSNKDRKLYGEAMARLMEKPKIGAKQSWSNGKSGNKGIITISEVAQQGKNKCYQFVSDFTIANGDDQGHHELTTEACSNEHANEGNEGQIFNFGNEDQIFNFEF